MRQGYTIVWGGWHGGLTGKNFVVMGVRRWRRISGKEIVGTVRTEIVADDDGVFSMPLSADPRIASYEAAGTDKSAASLTVREKSYQARVLIPNSEWEFASLRNGRRGKQADSSEHDRSLSPSRALSPITSTSSYTRPKIHWYLGSGFAAVRDTVSFLRYERKDRAGKPNPLAFARNGTGIQRAYAWGRSVSGRFIRDFIYHGANEDESHRQVFEAVVPLCGRRRQNVSQLRVRPAGDILAAAQRPTRPGTLSLRLQCAARSPDRQKRRHHEARQNRSLRHACADLDRIPAEARRAGAYGSAKARMSPCRRRCGST